MDPTAHQYVTLNSGADLQGFRQALRIMVWSEICPEQITWKVDSAPERFGSQAPAAYGAAGKPIILPRHVGGMIEKVICHSDPDRHARIYELVWRLRHGEKRLAVATRDPLVQRLDQMAEVVRADLVRMKASLRFQQVNDRQVGDRFQAWFEPDHFIIEAAAPFFIERFGSLHWTILTPRGSLRWDRKQLSVGPPAASGAGSGHDMPESSWRSFCETTFNPGRTSPWLRQKPLLSAKKAEATGRTPRIGIKPD
jgi:DNA polymerase